MVEQQGQQIQILKNIESQLRIFNAGKMTIKEESLYDDEVSDFFSDHDEHGTFSIFPFFSFLSNLLLIHV